MVICFVVLIQMMLQSVNVIDDVVQSNRVYLGQVAVQLRWDFLDQQRKKMSPSSMLIVFVKHTIFSPLNSFV